MNNTIRIVLTLCVTTLLALGSTTAADIISAASGSWSATATWVGGVVPTATDNVEIASGHSVILNVVGAECNNLTATGYLYFDSLNTGRKLTVHGNVLVGALGRIRSGSGLIAAPRAHDIVLEKDLTVVTGGNFDMRIGSGANVGVGRVVFSGTTNSTINLSLTSYVSNVEEFNSVIINKTGGAKVILASGNLFQNNNTTNSPDTLVFISGMIETGSNHWAILRTSSGAFVGASASSYVRGILGRGVSNGGGSTSVEIPVGDATNYRPVTVRLSAPANATGHYVWATLRTGNANTGSSSFSGGIDRVSAVRYFEIGYLQNAGTANTMGFYEFGPSYGTDDGVSAGNTDLRAAYSTNARATWTSNGPTNHTTTLATPPTTILGDSLTSSIAVLTGNSLFVALARATGTTTNTLGGGTYVVEEAGIPQHYFVGQNYPNPFNPATTIEYGLPKEGHVTLAVFNMIGQQVATLVNGEQVAGVHRLQFDASNLPSGIYFYRVSVGGFAQTNRMLLLK